MEDLICFMKYWDIDSEIQVKPLLEVVYNDEACNQECVNNLPGVRLAVQIHLAHLAFHFQADWFPFSSDQQVF